jgi:suppressor for copper-sensitivity B
MPGVNIFFAKPINRFRRIFAAIVTLILVQTGTGAPAFAEATAWVNSDFSQIRMIAVPSENRQNIQAGLHIRLEPGWKTYWRSPGDSGVPTIVDWSASKNISVSGLRWPVPHRSVVSGYQSFVYEDEVVLPVKLQVQDGAQTIHLKADVNYAVCKEICVPLQAVLSLDLEPGDGGKGASVHSRLLKKYLAKIPDTKKLSGLRVVSIALSGDADKQILNVVIEGAKRLVDPQIFVEAKQPFSFSIPNVVVSNDSRQAQFTFSVNGGVKKSPLAGNKIIVTVADAGQAVEISHQLQ